MIWKLNNNHQWFKEKITRKKNKEDEEGKREGEEGRGENFIHKHNKKQVKRKKNNKYEKLLEIMYKAIWFCGMFTFWCHFRKEGREGHMSYEEK